MKLVAISDVHLDAQTLGVPRMSEGASAIDQAVKHAIETQADAFLFLGDLADPDNGGATLAAIEKLVDVALTLEEHGIVFVAIAGNHDVVEDGSGSSCLTPLAPISACFERVHVVERFPRLVQLVDGVSLVCLPFAPVSHAYDPDVEVRKILSHSYVRATRSVIVAAHLTIPGIAPGEETLDMPRGRDVLFPIHATTGVEMRLSGHYHKRQVFDPGDGGQPIHVVGSSARFTFGEQSNEPAFLMIEI